MEYTYISRYMGGGHRGDDLCAERGTPVYAAQDGVVTYADFHYSYGNFVQLDHGTGVDGHRWTTLYAHMDDLALEPGQTVKAGELIGHAGCTGNATGNQVHFEMMMDDVLVGPSYFTDYPNGNANELTAEKVEEFLTKTETFYSDGTLEEWPLADQIASLEWQLQSTTDQLDQLKDRRDELQVSMDTLLAGTTDQEKELAENYRQQIDLFDQEIQLLENQIQVIQQQLEENQTKADAQSAQAQLQQQIDAAQAAGTGSDPALDAGAEAARQQLDAAAEQVDSYLTANRDQNG